MERYNISGLVSSSRENTSYLTNFLSVSYINDKLYNNMPGGEDHFDQTYGVYSKKGNVLILPLSKYLAAVSDVTVSATVFTYGGTFRLREEESKFDSEEEELLETRLHDSKLNFPSAATALASALTEFCDSGVIGVDLSDMTRESISVLAKNEKYPIKNAIELFRFVRMCKSEEEICRLRKAAEINEQVLKIVFEACMPGVRETDLESLCMSSIAKLGGECRKGDFMAMFGSRSGTTSPPTQAMLKKEKMFWVDFNCRYRGYYADTGESGFLGVADEKQNKYYNAVKQTVDDVIDAIQPGVRPSELNKIADTVWEKHGISSSGSGMGHGIGLEVHEYPRISAAKGEASKNNQAIKDDFLACSTDIPLETSMVLNIEAPYLIWGWGGAHLEKTIVVHNDGAELLVNQERQLRSIRMQ